MRLVSVTVRNPQMRVAARRDRGPTHSGRRATDHAGLAGRCGRIAVLRAEAAGMQTRLDALPAVTAVDLTDLAALKRKRDAAQATLDAIATRVELLAADGTVRLGDHRLAVGVPETITADADLAVGATRLRITPGGGTSLTEATRARDDANATLEARRIDDEFRTDEVLQKVLVDEHSTDRTTAIAVATAARDHAEQALAATVGGLAQLQPDLLRQAAVRLQRAVEKLIEGRQNAQTSRTVALERLRTEGTLDPREDLARARAAERLAASRHAQAARESRAYALLSGLFAEKKREVEAQFVEPLTLRVGEYLRCLFGPEASVSIDYAEGRFKTLALARPTFGSTPFSFDQLSGGGREQVAAELPLEDAELTSRQCHRLLHGAKRADAVRRTPGRDATGAVRCRATPFPYRSPPAWSRPTLSAAAPPHGPRSSSPPRPRAGWPPTPPGTSGGDQTATASWRGQPGPTVSRTTGSRRRGGWISARATPDP